MINVTKPSLPPIEDYKKYIDEIWERAWLTNNGPLVVELEERLEEYLGIKSLHYVTNGTIALHLALKVLDIKGEVITTPFSFVATTTAIIWENCTPIFVDITPDTLCIDVNKIEFAITEKTTAILATHVFGNPCDVEKIEEIARKHNLLVIYDAAHAFGVKYKSKSILQYGDISTLSFHATKSFHTIEGGGIINNGGHEIDHKIKLLRNFGLNEVNPFIEGTNAKNSEFHAAMGLANLNYIDENLMKRKQISELYNSILDDRIIFINTVDDVDYNYSYYPIILENEELLLRILSALNAENIYARRYFFPSLNKLPYLKVINDCPISESISRRILCLPLYVDLSLEDVKKIARLINSVLVQEGR